MIPFLLIVWWSRQCFLSELNTAVCCSKAFWSHGIVKCPAEMVFPTLQNSWLSLGEQCRKHHYHLFWEAAHKAQTSSTERLLILHPPSLLPYTVWGYFPQYLRWLKPCFMCTNTLPSLILPTISNKQRRGCAFFCFFDWNIGMHINLLCIWLGSVDTVWMVSDWGFLKVILVYTVPVEWLLYCAKFHNALPLKKVQICL